MSTTIPSDNDVPAGEAPLEPDWLQYLDGTWRDVQRNFARKRTRQRLSKALGTEPLPLLWALPDVVPGDTKQLVAWIGDWTESIESLDAKPKGKKGAKSSRPKKKKKKLPPPSLESNTRQLREWLDNIGHRPAEEATALECLAWVRALPWLAQVLPATQWGELFDTLRHMAYDAAGIPFGQMPVARQLYAGELPITLAALFDDNELFEDLAEEGMGCISLGMRELLDGEGVLHARVTEHQRSLLACWTRSYRVVKHSLGMKFDEDVKGQFEWLFRQTARWTGHDGAQMLNSGRSGKWNEDLMRAAMKLDHDPADLRAAAMLPWRSPPKIKNKQKSAKLPRPSCYSEWAEVAVLGAGWNPDDVRLAVAFNDGAVRCQLNGFGRTWIDGVWDFQLTVDQQPLSVQGNIEETCSHDDEDVSYLELQATFPCEWTIQRQILLDRRHQFLFVADAVLGEHPSNLDFRTRLPLAGSVKTVPANETREVTLKSGKSTADVLPLSLPEWRTERARGELQGDAESIELSQTVHGNRLYAPMFIHLHPNRSKRLTWRQLTVASNLQIQPPHVAAGYRVQFGEFQWLFYRSFGEVVPRTVLGLHLNHEFYAGRFLPDGEADELIAIDPSSSS